MTQDPSLGRLHDGDVERAWSLFVDRHRQLLFAVTRRYATDHDDVMDLFEHVCEQLRANDMARVRRYEERQDGRASFTTWLVVVVRHLAIDWIRARDGRPRPQIPGELNAIGRRIYQRLFIEGMSHRETMERELAESNGRLHIGAYLQELRVVHRVAFASGSKQLQRLRASSPVGSIASEQLASDVFADDVFASEAHRILGEALQSLDADVRLAVQLFVIDGVGAAEIAATVGWPSAKTVYNRVYRALTVIRQSLADRGIGEGDL